MAYNPQDPNKMKDEEPQGEVSAPPPQLSAASGSMGPTGPSASAPMSGSQPKGPSASGFTNVQKYIGANQQQGGALGEKIAGGINQTIDKASQMAGTAAQGYRDKINPDQFQFNAKTFDPTKVDTKQFSNLFTAPRSTYDDSAARASIGQAQQATKNIGTNEGRDQLVGEQQTLSKSLGANTAGQRYFDRLLFQGSKAGGEAITGTADRLKNANLEQTLAAQAQTAKAVDQEAKNKQAAAAAAARTAVGQQASSLQGQIAQQTAQKRSALENNQNQIFQALAGRQDVSDQNLQAFGLDRNRYNQIRQAFDARQNDIAAMNRSQAESARNNPLAANLGGPVIDPGFNLNPFITKTDLSGFGASNAVTADQIARARALEGLGKISGQQVGTLAPQAVNQFTNPLGSVDFQSLINALSDRSNAAVNSQPSQVLAENLLNNRKQATNIAPTGLGAIRVQGITMIGQLSDFLSGGQNAKANSALNEAAGRFGGVDIPSLEQMRLELERAVSAGELAPEEAQLFLQEQSELANFSQDPRLKQAQLGALESLSQMADGGLSDADKAALSQIESQERTQEKGQRDAILQQAAMRGAGGSGLELAQQLLNQQQSAQRQSQRDTDVAGMAQQRALQAIAQSGQLAGQIGQQDLNTASTVASARDSINRFNTQQMAGTNQANVQARNQAQAGNLAARQNLMNQNTGLANQERMQNAGNVQQQFQNRINKAGGQANIDTARADAATQQGAANQKLFGDLLGAGASAYQNRNRT